MFRFFKEEVKRSLNCEEKFIRESEHSDLTSTISFKIAKEKGEDAKKIAEKLVSEIKTKGEFSYIGKVEAINGYINFFVNNTFLAETIRSILNRDEDYGSLDLKGDVLIEHTSANPDGPLHIGHLRNSIIGDTLARIFKKAGFNVETQYYVNDMGRQTAIAVLGVNKFGLSEKKPDHAVAEAYIRMNEELEKNSDLEKEIEEIMKRYEDGDENVIRLFKDVVEKVLEGVIETLKNINVHHDSFVLESYFVRNGYVNRIFDILDKNGILIKNGAWKIDGSRLQFEKDVILRRENGTTLYITRDLAYHLWKNERYPRFINILGADHKLIGKQLSDILKFIGLKPPEIVFFEFVSLPEGSMSTRRGKFISADELIEKTFEEAMKLLRDRDMDEKEKIAKAVAVGALRFDFVKIAPEKHMVFDWKNALDFERQTASYIQYSHARACSILRKANRNEEITKDEVRFKPELCTDVERKHIILLSKFSYIIERVINELRPNIFAEYLMKVASSFNDFYRDHPVLNAKEEIRMHRLAIVDSTRIVLRNGLELLGIEALERM